MNERVMYIVRREHQKMEGHVWLLNIIKTTANHYPG